MIGEYYGEKDFFNASDMGQRRLQGSVCLRYTSLDLGTG